MKIRFIDARDKTIRLTPEIPDDLWHLEQVLEVGDEVSGITDRKIKGKDDNQKSERVTLWVGIKIEQTLFHEYANILKVNGTVTASKPENLAPLHSHQSIDFETGKEITIRKNEWKEHQIKRLRDAQKATGHDATLLLVLDDEQASFAWLKAFNLVMSGEIKSQKTGKRFDTKTDFRTAYFSDIKRQLTELKPKRLVIAGPGFTKDELKKEFSDTHFKAAPLVFFETTNSAGQTGLFELLKGDRLSGLVQEAQFIQDSQLLERFLSELGKNEGLAEYGFDAVKAAVERGAVSELLVTDREISTHQANVNPLLKTAEHTKTRVHILNAKTEPGAKLQSFGGIAAILRYRLH